MFSTLKRTYRLMKCRISISLAASAHILVAKLQNTFKCFVFSYIKTAFGKSAQTNICGWVFFICSQNRHYIIKIELIHFVSHRQSKKKSTFSCLRIHLSYLFNLEKKDHKRNQVKSVFTVTMLDHLLRQQIETTSSFDRTCETISVQNGF